MTANEVHDQLESLVIVEEAVGWQFPQQQGRLVTRVGLVDDHFDLQRPREFVCGEGTTPCCDVAVGFEEEAIDLFKLKDPMLKSVLELPGGDPMEALPRLPL